MIIVCTSDKKYINTFNAFAYSINKNSPHCKIVCRYIGEEQKLKSFNNCIYKFDNKKLRTTLDIPTEPNYYLYKYDKPPERLNNYQPIRRLYSEIAAYCTGIKYDTLYELMLEDNALLVYCDVDTIVRKDLSLLDKEMERNNADIGLVLDIQGGKTVREFSSKFHLYKEDVSLKTGGLMVFRKNKKTLSFLKYCKENIHLLDIDGDETVFDKAVKIFNPSILKIPTLYKDEGGKNASNFSKDSYMWSGHGEIKDFSSDYDKEVKKYLKAAESIL